MAILAKWRFSEISPQVQQKFYLHVQRGPLKSGDFHENGDLTKNRQRLNKNSNWMFKGTSWQSGDFDGSGDLAKFRQRVNENSNYIFQRAAWKVAVLTKMANVAKMSIWQKIAKSLTNILFTFPTGPHEKWRFSRKWRIWRKRRFGQKSPKV